MNSLILRTTSRILIVLVAVFSLYCLVRGHNSPGGGFVGGLLLAGAYTIYGLANGRKATERLLPFDLRTAIGAGVVLAIASGCLALLAGEPFFKGQWYALTLPGIGHLSSVLLFDVGVYITVFATALSIILSLAEES